RLVSFVVFLYSCFWCCVFFFCFRFFFFQAEDGIRDDLVTGVQTCALPIYTAIHVHIAYSSHMWPQYPRLAKVTARSRRMRGTAFQLKLGANAAKGPSCGTTAINALPANAARPAAPSTGRHRAAGTSQRAR